MIKILFDHGTSLKHLKLSKMFILYELMAEFAQLYIENPEFILGKIEINDV